MTRDVMLILSVGALMAIIILLYRLSLRAVMRISHLVHRAPAVVIESTVWARSRTVRVNWRGVPTPIGTLSY